MALHQRRETVMAFAEVHRITGHKNPHLMRGRDHFAKARAISAIRRAGVSVPKRTTTPPYTISIVACNEGCSVGCVTGSTIIGAKTGPVSSPASTAGAGRTKFPSRARRRQEDKWFGRRP
ncbi:hypothetical protein IWQ49_001031 [Labrenzia sp. EL_126]|nr:hypothetical protein [Labrenzia sp. EL_126]